MIPTVGVLVHKLIFCRYVFFCEHKDREVLCRKADLCTCTRGPDPFLLPVFVVDRAPPQRRSSKRCATPVSSTQTACSKNTKTSEPANTHSCRRTRCSIFTRKYNNNVHRHRKCQPFVNIITYTVRGFLHRKYVDNFCLHYFCYNKPELVCCAWNNSHVLFVYTHTETRRTLIGWRCGSRRWTSYKRTSSSITPPACRGTHEYVLPASYFRKIAIKIYCNVYILFCWLMRRIYTLSDVCTVLFLTPSIWWLNVHCRSFSLTILQHVRTCVSDVRMCVTYMYMLLRNSCYVLTHEVQRCWRHSYSYS